MHEELVMKIYQAGPLFSDAERTWHKSFKARLEAEGCEVVWPGDLISPEDAFSATKIMEIDSQAMIACDAVVALLDGAQVDDGTAWEIGFAYAKGIPIVGIRTDFRICSDSGEDGLVNAMIQGSVVDICRSADEVIGVLRTIGHGLQWV